MQYLLTEEEFNKRSITEAEIEKRIKAQVGARLDAFENELRKSFRSVRIPEFDTWALVNPENPNVVFLKWLRAFLAPSLTAAGMKQLPDPTPHKPDDIRYPANPDSRAVV